MSAQIAVADPALRIGAQASRRVTLDAEAIRDQGSGQSIAPTTPAPGYRWRIPDTDS